MTVEKTTAADRRCLCNGESLPRVPGEQRSYIFLEQPLAQPAIVMDRVIVSKAEPCPRFGIHPYLMYTRIPPYGAELHVNRSD